MVGPPGWRTATRRAWLAAATLALLVVLCVPAAASAEHRHPPFGKGSRAVCPAPAQGHARCLAEVATTASRPNAAPLAAATPDRGYRPADLRSAYSLGGLAATAGHGQTVAVVNAFNDPTAEQDLAVYRAQFGLPPCTTANGCFTKVNQDGLVAPLPPTNFDWSAEISLDLQAVSAICPNCRLLLVEADSDWIVNLAIAAETAAGMATQVSNSYGVNEFPGERRLDVAYAHPGVAMLAASGDDGFGSAGGVVGVSYPASSIDVTGVGGTTLEPADGTSRGWTETAWDGAGSGCSTVEPKPTWQPPVPGCPGRAVADVSAVADANTGLAIFGPAGHPAAPPSKWQVVGGTSAASPIVAAYEALLGPRSAGPSFPYSAGVPWLDVVAGQNGPCPAAVAVLCTAGPGYDGPTGLGTPDGPPASAVAPHVSGTPLPGATVSVSSGAWTGSPTRFAYAWWRCAPAACEPAAISGATGPSHVLGAGDRGMVVWATVDAVGSGGRSGPVASDNRIGPLPPPPSPPAQPAAQVPPAPVAQLAVTQLTIRPRAFRAGRRRAAQIAFATNLPAFVTFAVQRARRGRRVGGGCLAPTRARRKRPACTRYVALKGRFRSPKAGLTAAAVPTSFTFKGRLRGARLRPGRYRLRGVARGGGQTSKAAHTAFRIVR